MFKLFDRFRKWNYIQTKYDPAKSFAKSSLIRSEREQALNLEAIYEWNYDNLRGDWDHITMWTKKGPLCKSTQKHFFAFRREGDAVAFKLQWAE